MAAILLSNAHFSLFMRMTYENLGGGSDKTNTELTAYNVSIVHPFRKYCYDAIEMFLFILQLGMTIHQLMPEQYLLF